MTDPTIRPATPADVPAIRRIGEAAWRAAYGDFLPADVIDAAMAEWYDPEFVRESITRDDVTYLVAEVEKGVAEVGEEVAGYISGGPDVADDGGEDVEVAALAVINVDPDRWGEGIGSGLLSRFESACRDRGAGVVRARVLAKNDVGQPFYRKHGYEAVREREAELFGVTVRERVFQRAL